MGGTDNPAFHDAMVAYKLGEYREARGKWAPLLHVDPTNDTLRFYVGSASLAGGDAAARSRSSRNSHTRPPPPSMTGPVVPLPGIPAADELEKLKAMPLDDDPSTAGVFARSRA